MSKIPYLEINKYIKLSFIERYNKTIILCKYNLWSQANQC